MTRLVPLPYSRGRSTRNSDRLHQFSVTMPRSYKDVYVNSFFPYTTRPWNYLPIECFSLTNDLNGFKSRIKWHLLSVGSFWTDFLYALIFLYFFFLVTPWLAVAVKPYMEFQFKKIYYKTNFDHCSSVV